MSRVIRVRMAGAVLVAAAVLMAGCGAGPDTSTESTAPAAEETAVPDAPAADAEPAPAAAPAPEPAPAEPAKPAPPPVLVVETTKGSFEIETYPNEAPRTVEHIVSLAKRNFYNRQRIHRLVPGFVVQFGDPASRDMSRQAVWGQGGSGKPIGVAEIKRTHRLGAVAMAHAGDPAYADSQMYISLSTAATAQLDGSYTVFGQVRSGMDVVQKLEQLDEITRISVKP